MCRSARPCKTRSTRLPLPCRVESARSYAVYRACSGSGRGGHTVRRAFLHLFQWGAAGDQRPVSGRGRHDFPNQNGDTRPLALGISVEAVEQFQVEVNGQKAQWQGQGFHNYQLKSGTNQFHAPSTNISATRFWTLAASLRPLSRGSPERVRRERWRADRQEQNILFQQLQRLLLQHVFCSEFHHHPSTAFGMAISALCRR